METRFYQTRELDLLKIAQAVVLEYHAKGFQAQQFGDANQCIVQLKKENLLRTITGFNKALGISLQVTTDGTLVKVGAQDWVDQVATGAVGLVLHPLLVTAAVGAITQRNVVHEVLDTLDRQIRQQQPHVQMSVPPANS